MTDDLFAKHRRRLAEIRSSRAYDDRGRYRGPEPVRGPRPHEHDRGAILPDGRRGCWSCWIAAKLGVKPR